MTTTKMKLAAVVAALGIGSACVQGDPVSVAGNELGSTLLFTGPATDPAATLPGGSASVFLNLATLSIDLTAPDGFGRIGTTPVFRQFSGYWSPSNAAWFLMGDAVRNASAARIDPRYPHPTSTTAGLANVQFYQPGSPYPGDNYWEIFTGMSGLKPNTTYQIVLVHQRLTVAGALDQTERMLTGSVAEPDTLTPVAGTLGSANSDWSDTAPAGCDPFPGATTNPFVFGTFTSSAGGNATIDKCWLAGNGIWTMGEFGQQAKSMVGRNDNTTYALPNYNYIELWETAYGTGTGPAFRLQIAQDLAPDGTPINNATSPFPAPNTSSRLVTDQMLPPAVDRAAAYPLTGSQLLPLPASIGWPDSTVLTLNNLEAVTGVYQVWFVNPTTNQAVPATGTWTQVLGADTIATGSGNLAITGGPGTFRIVTDAYPVIGEPDISDSLSTLLVSVEQGASAASPSTVQPFWSTVLKRAGGSTGGTLPFGEFTFGDDSRGPERFVAQGKLAGGVIGNLVGDEFVGTRLEVSLTGLMRPPIGYQYRAYLCESDDDTCSPTNPTTTNFSLGGLMSPSGVSLDAADTAPNDSNLSDTRIVKAVISLDVTGAQTLCDFDRLRVVLEPKNGAGPPLAQMFSALLPAKVRAAESCR